jgi:hypothetical protein
VLKRSKPLAVAILVILPHFASAAQSIDVLVVFSGDVSMSSFDKTTKAAEMQLQSNAALLSSGILDRTFNFSVLATSLSYEATDKAPSAAILWMKNENDNPFSGLSLARENLVAGGVDLVYMVVSDWDSENCGHADDETEPRPPTNVSMSNSEEYAFAALALNSNSSCKDFITVPHELGHLLYSEHIPEIDSSGNPVSDNNENLFLPQFYNHGMEAANDDRTVMHGGQTNDSIPFFSGSTLALTLPHANVKQFITESPWTTVAAYRSPPQPPPSCKLQYEFAACSNGTVAIGNVTALLPGYTVTLADFDISTNSGGSWTDLYTGLVTCPGTPVYPNLFTRVRALLTTAYGVSQCEIPITINDCESGGSGGTGNPF